MLDDFQERSIAVLFHELRGPIAAMRAAAEQGMSEQDPERIRDLLRDTGSWADFMGHLISNASYTLLQKNAREKANSDCLHLIRDVVRPTKSSLDFILLQRGFPRNQITFLGFDNLPRIYSDGVGLQQVFFNLMTNAIKYSFSDPSRFNVEVRAQCTQREIAITFRDWGIGIDKSILPVIFDLGTRGETAIRVTATGQGIGLFVAHSIAKSIGGSLCVTNSSMPTEFRLTIPLQKLQSAVIEGNPS